MNKDVLIALLIIGAIGAILVGSLSYTNVYASTIQQRQACADKFLPQNTTQYDICIGGMKSGY
jgi:L-lactate permease